MFDSSTHLWGVQKFKPEDILTQRSGIDSSWNGELLSGSFVAVHSMVSIYHDEKNGGDVISFGLCAIQVLATPREK